ncbi:MAG TPA: KUP/HAK/KT family potassium transporter [Opitutus sp.]|nr:KUP/HAK/KT family potassium transporter [Opitutus sp.]
MNAPPAAPPSFRAHAAMCLGALGVVFGDIGTSPLYTMRECLARLPAVERAHEVLGVLSLMFWALMFEVSFKYLTFVTRADNRGEGGIFALLALSHRPREGGRRGIGIATLVALGGAALLFGDGVITPAISVLGAAEGFNAFNPGFERWVVPISIAILAALFLIQHRGTKSIGGWFGPVMLVWFATLAGLGLWHIFEAPVVFAALNPLRGLALLAEYPGRAAALLGSVVLTITGAEALYADLGHFGRRYIAQAWAFVVCPGLVLSYFGQGAYAIAHPDDPTNPFFAMAPEGPMRLVLVGLSIAAAIIASQALIAGTFSLARQAIQLGFFPRLKVFHTNPRQPGQIYLPLTNWSLAIGSIWIVFNFGSSTRLAAAYGVAITCTMVVTTFAFFRVTRRRWKWPLWQSLLLCGAFSAFDLTFFTANLHKLPDGGWLPILIAVAVLLIMHAWKTGRDEIQEKVYRGPTADLELADVVASEQLLRVPGSAVFMVASANGTPLALLHHLKANRCLHRTVVLLTIATEEVPSVPAAHQLHLHEVGHGVWRAIGRYGYMQSPDVAALIEQIAAHGVPVDPRATIYYFNREMIITGGAARMWNWQKHLYAFISRNAVPAKDYYHIAPSQIIEIGLPIQL